MTKSLRVFKNSPKLTVCGIFDELLSTQNVNVKWYFSCDFQTLCIFRWLVLLLRPVRHGVGHAWVGGLGDHHQSDLSHHCHGGGQHFGHHQCFHPQPLENHPQLFYCVTSHGGFDSFRLRFTLQHCLYRFGTLGKNFFLDFHFLLQLLNKLHFY